MQESEIFKEFEDQDYVFVASSKIEPSYYRLTEDNTVIRCLTRVHAIKSTQDGKLVDIMSTNEISAFVESQNRRPELFDPKNIRIKKEDVENDDVKYEVIRENFSVYKLTNGQTLSVKTVVSQITKYSKYNVGGEPLYNVIPNPIMRLKDAKK